MSSKQVRNRYPQRRNLNPRHRPDKRPARPSSEQVSPIVLFQSQNPNLISSDCFKSYSAI